MEVVEDAELKIEFRLPCTGFPLDLLQARLGGAMGGQVFHLIQARKLCNSLSFIDDLNLTNDDGEYKVI